MFKIVLQIIFIMATVIMLSGCGDNTLPETSQNNEISTEVSSVPEDKPISYDTVEPNADGWTTEEIMNVTYLCDKKLSYPLSLEFLGDDFSLSRYNKSIAEKRLIPVSLKYKGDNLANATVVKPHNEIMIYNIVLLPDVCKVNDVEPFVINGIKMYDSFEDVLNALGDGYRYMTDDSLLYDDRETGESLYSLFFEDGKLVHINVDFQFEIDLPLYQDLQRRFQTEDTYEIN
ncbi:MAG: hypothetical protein NC177_09275 [Ruminococcus flavefaciens]|nr:hypothetical protein [Ruminococcus flavefaciens]